MSILETRAPALPKLWSLPYVLLSNAAYYGKVLSDTFAEAQQMAREAERRYPFSGW